MATEKTTNFGWDKPVFPSDNLPTELGALIDQIDADAGGSGSSWTVSDDGTEVLQNPNDLDFGTGLSVTDDLDSTLTLDVTGISESELTFDPATQLELDSHAGDASAHHSRYTDTEAATAAPVQSVNGSVGDVTVSTFSGSHADLTNVGASDHHTRYADSEAVSAVNAETSLSVDITGDADTVDGKHASEFVDQIFLAEGTNTDINNSTNVSWNNTTIIDSPYSFDGTNVTIQESGTYEIVADADFSSNTARSNANIGIQKNRNWFGVVGRSGYVRYNSGHNHSSVHTRAIGELSVGDSIRVRGLQEAQSDNVVPDRAQFYIKKLNR